MSAGVKTMVAGGLLFFGGALVVPMLIIVPLMLDKSKDSQFLVPGTTTITVKESGKYYLWNHYQTVFEGTSYNRPEAIPDGLEISIVNEAGESIPFISNTSITSNVGSSAKRSIGYTEITDTGPVEVRVSGESVAPSVFSFAPTKIWRILGAVMVGIVLSGFVCLTGGALLIWGIVQVATVKNEPPAAVGVRQDDQSDRSQPEGPEA